MDIWFSTYGCGYAPPGWKISHLSYTNRLYVVLGGTAYFIDGNEERRLLTDRVYLFPHRLPFQVRQDENDRINHLYFDFVITPPLLGEELIEIPLIPGSLMDLTVQCLMHTTERGNRVLEPIMRGYFENLLRLIIQRTPHLWPSDQRLSEVFRCMHEQFSQPLTDEKLAQMVHLEKNHFIRVFKRASGMTPYQYLREYRLNRAVAVLQNGASVEEAAISCGYENAASLSHAMKKSRGVNPSDLINRI